MRNLRENTGELLRLMREQGYGKTRMELMASDLAWLSANGGRFDCYEDACAERESETSCPSTKSVRRTNFRICRRFDLEGRPPELGVRDPLYRRDSHQGLCEGLRDLVDRFREQAPRMGLSPSTAESYARGFASLPPDVQSMGRGSLAEVTEADLISHFCGPDGPRLTRGPRSAIVSALSCDLGPQTDDARRLAALLPRPRSVRKNIDYLRPEECEAIEAALRADPPSLSTRDVAIGALMYHTGMRASDVAGLLLTSIDWERETVSTRQSKTGAPLVLPLLASFGNAICGYLANGRPESGDPHLFLSERRPHGPIGSACVRGAARRLYAAAGIRTGKGDHRGSHLMRHNAATTMVDSGVSRAVASAVLGHTSPESIDSYLFADIEGLRTCALDVSAFPVAEGVFA